MVASAIITVMSNAAIKAGKGLLRDFGEVDQLQISRKSASNFVTQSDIRTEKLLRRELSAARAGYGFLMEESGEVKGTDERHRWIIDPLDGTSNFIHAIPYFCISIGLERTHSNGGREIIAGVIYDPIHNELFTAEKGKGAEVNNRRLQVSARDTMEQAMIVSGSPRDVCSHLNSVSTSGATVRYFGATALDLAYLAAGRIDACWYQAIQPWDVAAGMLLVQEAGGICTKLDGTPGDVYSPSIIASNRALQLPVHAMLGAAA
jgi:myo-inositol-1(or 4)-monophosphatase